MKIFLILFLLTSPLYSKVRHFDVTRSEIHSFGFKETCQKFNMEPLLVSAPDSHSLDCTGQKLEAVSFCEKAFKNKRIPFLRAIVDPKTKQVHCHGGTEAVLSIYCQGKFKNFCTDKNKSCMALRKVFTKELELSFSGVVEDNEPILNCYFSQKEI